LFLDNAPVHVQDESTILTNLKLVYFPPNLTCMLQPLDAGIIRSVKALCRKFQIQSLLHQVDQNKHAADLAKKMTILDAVQCLSKAWSMVTSTTIQKCFQHCGFCSDGASNSYENIEFETDFTQLATQIGIEENDIVFEEHLPEFEVNEENMVSLLVQEHLNSVNDFNGSSS
jgi:DDE superfamily endonuclease